jgi:hypothetical protein
MRLMGSTHLIAACVSPETKARFRSFAERQQMSESALLKRLVDLAMRGAGGGDEDVVKSSGRRLSNEVGPQSSAVDIAAS